MHLNKIAVFGFNPMSFELIKCLDSSRHQIIVVDKVEEHLSAASEMGCDLVATDYRDDANLEAIGIGRDIGVLFCFFPEDSENIFLTLSTRALDKDLEIVSIVDNPESADKLMVAGANRIIDPYQICGRKIYQLVKNPDIVSILDHTIFGRHDLNMAEISIPLASPLENSMASQLNLNKKFNLILIAIVDKELGKELHFVFGGKDHKLDAGDILVVLGGSQDISNFKKNISIPL